MNSKKIALTTLIFAGSIGFANTAFAISDVAECNLEVKQVIKDLLKANVSADALAQIDAAILAAEDNCKSKNFGEAESQLNNARDMLKAAGQN